MLRSRASRTARCTVRNVCSLNSGSSSPRVRGTPLSATHANAATRFIPAGAGNAWPMLSWGALWAVHPRGCGERPTKNTGAFRECGSSPRVRGTRVDGERCSHLSRFIPAGAGNAPSGQRAQTQCTVHPRGCGERSKAAIMPSPSIGSSPRVRGTLDHDRLGRTARRFIPAGAGNANVAHGSASRIPVHPRGCGERHQAL